MSSDFAIVDIFAGPGGLAEGFSNVRDKTGGRPFSIALSVEKEASAYETLLLRSFLRKFEGSYPKEYYSFLNDRLEEPDWSELYPTEWKSAAEEALNLELGESTATRTLNQRLDAIQRKYGGNIVLIGGPPCQAYSIVGRARNKGVEGYKAGEDHRHFLYREYIRILKRLRPAAFVMENVKGILSSVVDGEGMFDKVLKDLRAVNQKGKSYQLVPLVAPPDAANGDEGQTRSRDFVVQAEHFGIPQARHRVIIVGIRSDFAGHVDKETFLRGILRPAKSLVTVRDVIGGMPSLRSGLSQSEDSTEAWRQTISTALEKLHRVKTGLSPEHEEKFRALVARYRESPRLLTHASPRLGHGVPSIGFKCPPKLRNWLMDPALKSLPNNETRGHMASDLTRYLFAALIGKVTGVSPKAADYPASLAPDHANWKTGKFADRFRVQLWKQPSTTVTCHISKDGHYFIHPDPLQCRSLTVREAARLQTFPDNYFFKGNRTEQYVQVGNAVPPFLAKQIAQSLYSVLIQKVNARRKPGPPT